jgi:hypothetical protein
MIRAENVRRNSKKTLTAQRWLDRYSLLVASGGNGTAKRISSWIFEKKLVDNRMVEWIEARFPGNNEARSLTIK